MSTAFLADLVVIVAKVLIDAGSRVLVETPTYLGALQAMQLFQPRLVGIPEDASGMRVDLLAEGLAAGLAPKLVYLTPTFANPSGTTMPFVTTLARFRSRVATGVSTSSVAALWKV